MDFPGHLQTDRRVLWLGKDGTLAMAVFTRALWPWERLDRQRGSSCGSLHGAASSAFLNCIRPGSLFPLSQFTLAVAPSSLKWEIQFGPIHSPSLEGEPLYLCYLLKNIVLLALCASSDYLLPKHVFWTVPTHT